MAAAKKAENRKLSDFLPTRLEAADQIRTIYQATVEPNVEREDLQNPKFWAHVARALKPGFRVEVLTDDMRFFAELMVIDCGSNWATLKELRFDDLTTLNVVKGSDIKSGFEVTFKGPHLKFCVIRKEDNAVIKDGFNSETEAHKAMAQHVEVLSR